MPHLLARLLLKHFAKNGPESNVMKCTSSLRPSAVYALGSFIVISSAAFERENVTDLNVLVLFLRVQFEKSGRCHCIFPCMIQIHRGAALNFV